MTEERPVRHLSGRWIAVLLTAALTAGACSDSGDEGDSVAAGEATSSSTTTTVPTTTSTSATTSTTVLAAPTTSRRSAPGPSPTTTAAPRSVLPPPAVVAAPTDPAELARMMDELVAAETALRNPSTPDGELARLARRQQAIYRALSARPEALNEARDRIPEALRPAVEANVSAGAELRALTKPKTELPPWRIIAPPPATELEQYYREAEQRFGVPWAYLASVHLVETRMGRIRGTSSAGAKGPMQFLPSTWERWGEGGNIEAPHDSILAAGRYLKATGAPGDMAKALYAYNHSDRYVRAVTAYARQIEADPRAYLAYYHWQVYYITPPGDVLLDEGYGT